MTLQHVEVDTLPECDFCTNTAHYDAKSTMGPWANMCEQCFSVYGTHIGNTLTERQQRTPSRTFTDTPTVTIPLESIALQSIVEVQCPWCGGSRRVEPDANYEVQCESCGNPYKIRSMI